MKKLFLCVGLVCGCILTGAAQTTNTNRLFSVGTVSNMFYTNSIWQSNLNYTNMTLAISNIAYSITNSQPIFQLYSGKSTNIFVFNGIVTNRVYYTNGVLQYVTNQ